MTNGQRLRKFIKKTYGTQTVFANKVGITNTALNRYIHDTHQPKTDVLLKFKQAGLSIDWLLDGSGPMICEGVSSNEIPYGLFHDKALPHQRIKKWIIENFGSYDSFAAAINMDFYILEKILEDELVPDPTFINSLRMAGCNIKWLSTGKGSEYANNHLGLILEMRRNRIVNNADNGELQIDFRKVIDFTARDFFEFIKLTIRDEFNKKLLNENDQNI